MTIRLRILGRGLSAPGLADMAALEQVLAGADLGEERPDARAITVLSARERRRCPETVRLSLAAAEQACRAAEIEPNQIEAVFCSGMGDLAINDYLCRTLADQPEQLSPLQFHNSVHNAAAGYWSIGTGCIHDVTAISGSTDSLVTGLYEAAARVLSSARPVLLVVYDAATDGPLKAVWTARHPFAGALLLGPDDGPGDALVLRPEDNLQSDACPSLSKPLDARIKDNPAARCLHLLALHFRPQQSLRLAARQGPGLCVDASG